MQDIKNAATDPKLGTYTPSQHMFLRRNYCIIYVTADGKAIDTHKHYVEAAGHTEHAWFIQELVKDAGGLKRIASGPKPKKGRGKGKKGGRRCEELQAIMKAPSQRGPIDDPKVAAGGQINDSLFIFWCECRMIFV